MDSAALNELHMCDIELLDEFDRVCRKNGLRYSLYAGSLIGAVRHKGFIPWDDDIDICMLRKEYDRLNKIWKDESQDGYQLINHDNCPAFDQSFTKLFKTHSTLLLSPEPVVGLPNGINIDIFPVDRIPNGIIRRTIFKIKCMLYHLLLRKHEPNTASAFVRFVSRTILRFRNSHKDEERISKLLKHITKRDEQTDLDLILVETTRTLHRIYPHDLFDNIIELEFENKKYYCFSDWDTKLRIDFGDYMTLPPIEERQPPHDPYLIDTSHSIEELQKMQQI